MTKQEKIEKLIQMEWEDFQKVNNEGGRASCQDDPETFFIMRRSHFSPWTEDLIACVPADKSTRRNIRCWRLETGFSTVLKIRRMILPSRRTCLENCGLTRTALCIRTGSLSMN